jgi:hypothetical protein
MESSSNIDAETINRLQDLVVHNPDLERLESILDRFNIFEALGAVHQEVRHSDFLSFLLNPRQNHGLGDLFVKRLLQEAIAQADFSQPITPIDLDIWDLDDIDVRREWQSIDILILDDLHQMAVIIENKIYSGEHDDQLNRYRRLVKQHYPCYRNLGLFLTPEGEGASEANYINISYALICQLVEDIIRTREATLGRDVLALMDHYKEMLRRYIVGESDIEKLCQQIYRKHQRALDLIYEYRPDQQAAIKDFLCDLIASNAQMILDHSSKSYIRFIPKIWDSSVLRKGQGWTHSGRILLFQFENRQDSLKISLSLGPGPDEIRQKLFEFISQNEPPFKRSFKALGRMWSTVYSRNFLTKNSYQEKTTEELQEEIKHRWNEFLDHELPKLDAVILSEIERLGSNLTDFDIST